MTQNSPCNLIWNIIFFTVSEITGALNGKVYFPLLSPVTWYNICFECTTCGFKFFILKYVLLLPSN